MTSIHPGEEGTVTDIDLKDTVDGADSNIETDGVFIFIGHIPNNDLYRKDFHLDDEGYLVTDKHMRTNVPGVFAAGEIQDKVFKQVATSVGQGCAAAMQAGKFIEDLETHPFAANTRTARTGPDVLSFVRPMGQFGTRLFDAAPEAL